MENENIGYVKDWTTCHGGENLSDKDKQDIQIEAEKIWGDK